MDNTTITALEFETLDRIACADERDCYPLISPVWSDCIRTKHHAGACSSLAKKRMIWTDGDQIALTAVGAETYLSYLRAVDMEKALDFEQR